MDKNRKTIWVLYKNIDWKYEKESKIPQKILEAKFNQDFHKKLFLKNLFQKFSEYKFLDFFNNHWWLWWFLWVLFAIIIALITWIFFSNTSWNIENNNINNSQNINITSNSWQIAIWDDNTLIQNKLPTNTEQKQYKQWEECETTFRAFIRRINRNDFEYAHNLFDKYLKTSTYFSIENLEKFKTKFVQKDLEIWEINKKFIDDSDFVSRCEFDFKLRYLNKNDWKDKIEMWKWVVLKNKDEVNYFQIWELKCLDKKCENNPLFD